MVERHAGPGEAVRRVGRELGPRDLDAVAAADDAEADVADPAVGLIDAHTRTDELGDRAGREAVVKRQTGDAHLPMRAPAGRNRAPAGAPTPTIGVNPEEASAD